MSKGMISELRNIRGIGLATIVAFAPIAVGCIEQNPGGENRVSIAITGPDGQLEDWDVTEDELIGQIGELEFVADGETTINPAELFTATELEVRVSKNEVVTLERHGNRLYVADPSAAGPAYVEWSSDFTVLSVAVDEANLATISIDGFTDPELLEMYVGSLVLAVLTGARGPGDQPKMADKIVIMLGLSFLACIAFGGLMCKETAIDNCASQGLVVAHYHQNCGASYGGGQLELGFTCRFSCQEKGEPPPPPIDPETAEY